jgi:polyisoprenoid-binding protein YceI
MRSSITVGLRFVLIAAGIVGAAELAVAQVRGQTPAERAEARSLRLRSGEIDTDLSRVFIFVDKTGLGHQHGVVGRLKAGNLRIAKESAGKILFDMASFRADTEEARRKVGLAGAGDEREREQVTAAMLSAVVLDIDHFPTALFALSSVRRFEERDAAGNTQFGLDGEFTLHGTTHRVHITATGATERGFLHLKGAFPLRQTDYGIRPFRKALGAVGVADVLTVYGDLWVKQ